MNRNSNRVSEPTQRALSPLPGLLVFSALLVTACALPSYFILRSRRSHVDKVLSEVLHVARAAAAQHTRAADVAREVKRVGAQIEVLRGQVDRAAGDIRDVRSIVLKDRVRLAAVEARFDALSEQLKTHEQRVLAGLAAEQKRNSKTDNEINELRRTVDQNASKLSKVGISLADIASFIDRTEIEQGVLPEEGKESSERVNSLRNSALGVLKSVYKSK